TRRPSPPIPSTPTRSPDRAPLLRNALNVVIPAHINGAPSTELKSCGTDASAFAGATMYSAYPPSNEIPVVSNSTWQAKKSPRRHGSQCPQCEACHPTPTRCPDFQSGTSGPTASITPITSWPGILGYWIPGQSPSLTNESL